MLMHGAQCGPVRARMPVRSAAVLKDAMARRSSRRGAAHPEGDEHADERQPARRHGCCQTRSFYGFAAIRWRVTVRSSLRQPFAKLVLRQGLE